jgi:basic membrane lipoprotein Med (substrate-binding protein (PBP1-ABC) superfamily)
MSRLSMTRIMRRSVMGMMLAGAAALSFAGTSSRAEAFTLKGKPKVAFIYAATARDGGWNEAIDNARQDVEKELGLKIAVSESIPEETTAVMNAIDLYVKRGFNIIVTTSYGYSDGALEAAKKYPDVAFLGASQITNAANLESFYARTYQGWYLAGMAAGGVTKSHKLGMLAGFPAGVVNWDINAFTLGARSVDPSAQTIVIYTNSWWDPVKEGQVAEAMLDQGADVIANNLSSTAPYTAAEKRGAYSVGFQLDQSAAAPNGHLTSVLFQWQNYLIPTIKNIIAGTWKPEEYGALVGMDQHVVSLSPLSAKIPAEVKAKIEKTQAEMEAGTFSPYIGPVKKQDGSIAVPEGKTIDDEGLWNMDYLVEGTIGTVPAAQ